MKQNKKLRMAGTALCHCPLSHLGHPPPSPRPFLLVPFAEAPWLVDGPSEPGFVLCFLSWKRICDEVSLTEYDVADLWLLSILFDFFLYREGN